MLQIRAAGLRLEKRECLGPPLGGRDTPVPFLGSSEERLRVSNGTNIREEDAAERIHRQAGEARYCGECGGAIGIMAGRTRGMACGGGMGMGRGLGLGRGTANVPEVHQRHNHEMTFARRGESLRSEEETELSS